MKGMVVSQSSMHQEIAVEGFVGCWGELEQAQVGGRQQSKAVLRESLQLGFAKPAPQNTDTATAPAALLCNH